MDEDFQAQMSRQTEEMRRGAEDLIREASGNIDMYDRIRWHIAAECSHAVAIMRVIDHRNQVVAALVDRLAPRLPPPVTREPASTEIEDNRGEEAEQTIGDILRAMRAKEAQSQARPPFPGEARKEEWGASETRASANRGRGGY